MDIISNRAYHPQGIPLDFWYLIYSKHFAEHLQAATILYQNELALHEAYPLEGQIVIAELLDSE